MPANVDQCMLDQATHVLGCAGRGKLCTVRIMRDAAPVVLEVVDTGHPVHTVAVDVKTHWLWTVWAADSGDFVQAYKVAQ